MSAEDEQVKEFFTAQDLSRLYDKEYHEEYGDGLFGAFMPAAEPETWARHMVLAQRAVEMRAQMTAIDTHESAARLMFNVIKRHKLTDGNKRSALLCMIAFYFMNGFTTTFNPEDLYRKSKEIAGLDSRAIDDDSEIRGIGAFFKSNTEFRAAATDSALSEKERSTRIDAAAKHTVERYGHIIERLAKE